MSQDEIPRNNRKGGVWLIADMALVIWSLSIVKWLGADYPAIQIVFLRALSGLVLILPFLWVQRDAFRKVEALGYHLARVAIIVVTLTASFFAVARVPFALFSAMNFTRPIVTMVLAAVLLRETIGPRRWIAAGVAFCGVLVALTPSHVPWTPGLVALVVLVLTGSLGVIMTRRLRTAPPIVMMTFYTAGLLVCSAPFAVMTWQSIDPPHLLPLLLIGVLSQMAQYCFLRAHFFGEAGYLSVLSYLSLVFSVSVGYLAFGEVPDLSFALGAVLVIAPAIWVTLYRTQSTPGQNS